MLPTISIIVVQVNKTPNPTPRNALFVRPLVGHVFYPHLTRTHTNLMCERRLEDDNDNNNEEEEEEEDNDDKEE